MTFAARAFRGNAPLTVNPSWSGFSASGSTASYTWPSANANASGGTPPYTYSWAWSNQVGGVFGFSGGSTSATATPTVSSVPPSSSAAARLTLTVTDALGANVSLPADYDYTRI